MRSGIVTLLSDFGAADGYVAAMKGVILSVAPALVLVDVSHEVAPQDLRSGALLLAQVAPFFPPGTVHLAVVDPGVGSAREPIAVETERAVFVGPNNGLLSLAASPWRRIHLLESSAFHRAPVSATFHGRDVFAPAAAYLAAGAAVTAMGPALEGPRFVQLRLPEVRRAGNELAGEVVHIDRFGNLVTNLRAADLPAGGTPAIRVGTAELRGVHQTYSEVAPGELLAYLGSGGLLEIAVREGSAAARLAVERGATVRVTGGSP